MGDQDWSELWEMPVQEVIELWRMLENDLAFVPFCRHLKECEINGCECCDCRMFAVLESDLSPADMEEEKERARLQKIRDITLKKREEIELIKERVALYEARRHLLED